MKDFGVKVNVFFLEDKEVFCKEIVESVVLVNVISLGMKLLDELSIVDDMIDVLCKDLIVIDVVYNFCKIKLLI